MSGQGASQIRRRYPHRICPHRRRACARRGEQAAAARSRCARQRAQARLVGRLRAAEAELPRHAGAGRLSDRRACRLHRLVAVLRHLGADRKISGDPRRRQSRRGGAQPLRRRAGDAATDRRRDAGSAPAPSSASGRPTPTATTSWCLPTSRAGSRSRRCTRCASSSRGAKAAPISRSPISSRRARAGSPTTSAPSRSPPVSARTTFADRFKRANDDYSVDPGQGAGRPSGRSFRRAPASARAARVLGLCVRRNAQQR